MRTTLDIEEDVLLAARDIAQRRRSSIGRVLSDLARLGLVRSAVTQERNGIPLFPVRPDGGIVTPELVHRLRDEEP